MLLVALMSGRILVDERWYDHVFNIVFQAQLRMQSREVPRSLFQFEFDLERRIIAEADQQRNPHLRASTAQTSQANGGDNLAEVSPFDESECLTISEAMFGLLTHLLSCCLFLLFVTACPWGQRFGSKTRFAKAHLCW